MSNGIHCAGSRRILLHSSSLWAATESRDPLCWIPSHSLALFIALGGDGESGSTLLDPVAFSCTLRRSGRRRRVGIHYAGSRRILLHSSSLWAATESRDPLCWIPSHSFALFVALGGGGESGSTMLDPVAYSCTLRRSGRRRRVGIHSAGPRRIHLHSSSLWAAAESRDPL
ncbi:hypothetical protein BDZ97DRAFT_1916292 [Flammula alnicola]|nr:hypothetical protein BDZ97DRAFT_1916292 [Flammula alnicola]